MSACLVLLALGISTQLFAQKDSRTKVIAHRGAWKNTKLPQNAISSLNAAIKMGCFATECDIWMTADSVLVVNHDPEFYDLHIETSTHQQLLEKKHPNGESIATLDQFLEVIRKQKATRLVLDRKPSKISKERSVVIAQKSYRAVMAAKAGNIVGYILFDYDACLALEKLAPKENIAYLLGDKTPQQVHDDGLWGIDYHQILFERNPTWIEDAKRLKLTINVWTVNEQAAIESFISRQVDYITTDEPELALKLVKAQK